MNMEYLANRFGRKVNGRQVQCRVCVVSFGLRTLSWIRCHLVRMLQHEPIDLVAKEVNQTSSNDLTPLPLLPHSKTSKPLRGSHRDLL